MEEGIATASVAEGLGNSTSDMGGIWPRMIKSPCRRVVLPSQTRSIRQANEEGERRHSLIRIRNKLQLLNLHNLQLPHLQRHQRPNPKHSDARPKPPSPSGPTQLPLEALSNQSSHSPQPKRTTPTLSRASYPQERSAYTPRGGFRGGEGAKYGYSIREVVCFGG